MSRAVELDQQSHPESRDGGRGASQKEELGVAFRNHRGELLGLARRSLEDGPLAEEAVQETFVRALRARRGFDARLGAMRSWLFAIERRVIVDLARARRAHRVEPLREDSATSSDQLEGALNSWNVEAALRRLGPQHQQVVLEIYYGGRSSRDLARELGVPEGTVRSRLYYALRALRGSLEELGWTE
ncbi:MAG TPA: sigma-70 family RNA polymerase sigma factor [Candidatus Dormibacteraeota bacterium]|nr:sigma-70 family RNA polymerase sigma factor [Candidatus Dormibacteraeota bacterium]